MLYYRHTHNKNKLLYILLQYNQNMFIDELSNTKHMKQKLMHQHFFDIDINPMQHSKTESKV